MHLQWRMKVSSILLTSTPSPSSHCLGEIHSTGGLKSGGGGLLHRAMKEDLMPVSDTGLKKKNYKLVPSMKKKKKKKKHFVCAKCQLFLLIGINGGELLCVTIQVNSFLGKCFFFSQPRTGRDGVPLFFSA